MELRLRPFRIEDESIAIAAHAELREDDFTFLLHYDEALSWTDYLARCEEQRRGINLPEGIVRGAFLAAEVDGELVGRVSLRFALNDFLFHEGGHIGYAIRPPYRRRGHARDLLGQALVLVRSEGVHDVLVTCDDQNVASAGVIEANGGALENVVMGSHGRMVRRYWIR
jgi:predicted acetyltransferase